MKTTRILSTAALLTGSLTAAVAQSPNVVVIMTDQQRADLCGREGFPMEITPFVDSMARNGAWFNRAYTTAPASVPARTSFLTGRFPKATHVRSNHNVMDAYFEADLFGTAQKQGYNAVLVGKNHSYMTAENANGWIQYDHAGGKVVEGDPYKAFNEYIRSTSMYAHFGPAPCTTEEQQPYRMVTDAVNWIGENREKPFVMWLSFPEPHNPYQVNEPYYSQFAADKIPPTLTDSTDLAKKGPLYVHYKEMMKLGHVDYDKNLQQLRGQYMGMIRLIDDQIGRFVNELKQMGIYENTIFVVLADHGDYAGEYGLMKKGVGLGDVLTRIPMVWFGYGIDPVGLRADHVSLADVFPTICEAIGAEIPMGVQGRSLWNMLQGKPYPKEEFESVMTEGGYGGQFYTKEDGTDYLAEGCVTKQKYFFDELNTWTQSGTLRMLRKGDWKLVYDMTGHGELYNMSKDPMEMNNLFGKPQCAEKQAEMVADLLKWELATEDPLPIPRKRYHFKRYPHNYLFCPE